MSVYCKYYVHTTVNLYSVYNVHDTTSLNSEYNRHNNESANSGMNNTLAKKSWSHSKHHHDLIFPGTHLKI